MGCGGFGYDPIFKPLGHSKTFAQLPINEKNKIGHRGRAVAQLIQFFEV
jgi:XTP/dITP diphosphohydrolase